MNGYCKNCDTTHAVWNRLNDNSAICGRCGTRVRDSEQAAAAAAIKVDEQADKLRLKKLVGGA